MEPKGKAKVIQMLVEAHSNELALINVLEAHRSLAEPGSYRSGLDSHLRETREHAEKIGRRLERMGYRRSLPAVAYGFVQNTVKQGLVLTKAPIDMLRGRGNTKEKMLRNAMDEAMTEGLEIASYDAIESLARAIGDHETAELAAEIRLDEERMLETLRKEIPVLASEVAGSVVPDTERGRTEPWAGYDGMTVEQIRSELAGASESLKLTVRDYEKLNKNRSTVIEATE